MNERLAVIGPVCIFVVAAGGAEAPANPAEYDRIVGVAFAKSNAHAYAWTAAGSVSSGTQSNFAWHRSPYRFVTAPNAPPSSIVGVAIAADDRVYAWYANQTRSVGRTASLAEHHAPEHYEIPGNRTPENIVGIAILGSNDHVYAWYDDGMVSVGDSRDLGSRTGPGKYWPSEKTYSLPGRRSPGNIVGIAFGPNTGLAFAWYDDGYASAGKSWSLGSVRPPFRYARYGIVASAYPLQEPSGGWNTGGSNNAVDSTPTDAIEFASSSADDLVAAGHSYVAVTKGQGKVYFYHRNGSKLTGAGLDDHALDLGKVFAPFLRTGPGSPAVPTDVNHYMNFSNPCDTYPQTDGYRFCVGEVYDTRVEYDRQGRRWVIYANARNSVWTNLFSADPGPDEDGSYGRYKSPSQVSVKVGADLAGQARRVRVFAVSRTEDPRDGFHTYAFVQNVYRDWPWMSVNGNWLTLAHRGQEHVDGVVAALLPLQNLRDGAIRPRFTSYFSHDLAGVKAARPPRQYGTMTGHSLLLGYSANRWRVFALRHPSVPFDKRTVEHSAFDKDLIPDNELHDERVAFRNRHLHFVRARPLGASSGGVPMKEIVYNRVGLDMNGNTPVLSYGTDHRRRTWDSYSPSSPYGVSFMQPAIDVNVDEDVLITFGASQGISASSTGPVQRSIWRVLWKGTHTYSSLNLWRLGHGVEGDPTHDDEMKGIAGAVDPDGRRFWAIHQAMNSNNEMRPVVLSLDP